MRMIKKALTYLTILAITALPVQLISASVDVLGMQLSMSQPAQLQNQCMSESNSQHIHSDQSKMDKSSCDDQSYSCDSCDSCDNCPQAVTAMFSSFDTFVKPSSFKTQKDFISYLSLNGISQKNLLRPPRTSI